MTDPIFFIHMLNLSVLEIGTVVNNCNQDRFLASYSNDVQYM
jgi:hypothetical protein